MKISQPWAKSLPIVSLLLATSGSAQPYKVKPGDSLYRIAVRLLAAEGVTDPTEAQISAEIEAMMENPLNDGLITASGNGLEVGVVLDTRAPGSQRSVWRDRTYRSYEHPVTMTGMAKMWGDRFALVALDDGAWQLHDTVHNRTYVAEWHPNEGTLVIPNPPFQVRFPEIQASNIETETPISNIEASPDLPPSEPWKPTLVPQNSWIFTNGMMYTGGMVMPGPFLPMFAR